MDLYKIGSETKLAPWKKDALESFSSKMRDQETLFPCIPAVAGHHAGHLRYGFIEPSADTSSQELAGLLAQYGKIFHECGRYTSLVVFAKQEHTGDFTIEEAENGFWDLLTRVHHQDPAPWPDGIPMDPAQTDWEYCYDGVPYFVYCATPLHHERKSRHFPYTMLAFTPRQLLIQFNESPAYAAKIKKQIRKRLTDYDAVPAHPSLNTYGNKDNFEWKQYFLHDGQTERPGCPFHPLKKETE